MPKGRMKPTVIIIGNNYHNVFLEMLKEVEKGEEIGIILYRFMGCTSLICTKSLKPSLNPILGGFTQEESDSKNTVLFESKIVSVEDAKARLANIGYKVQIEVISVKERKQGAS